MENLFQFQSSTTDDKLFYENISLLAILQMSFLLHILLKVMPGTKVPIYGNRGSCTLSLGKFDWGVLHVTLIVRFWIRLAAVCYHGKEVYNVSFHALRSVNRSRDTQNGTQNKTRHNVPYVSLSPRVYITKPRLLILYDLLWKKTTCNYNCRDSSHCDRTGQGKMAVLGIASDHSGNPLKFFNYVIA